MKIYLILALILYISGLFIPVIAISVSKNTASSSITAEVTDELKENTTAAEDVTVKVFRTKTEETTDIGIKEYIIGCVAGEMPASYNTEALKAQAVASYTYAKYIKENNSYDGYTLTDSSAVHQSYIDTNAQKEKWGDDYNEYRSRIEDAVNSVYGEYLTFKGKTALTAFHASSPDKTASAAEIWNTHIPYLVSTDAPCNNVPVSECRFTSNEFRDLFEKNTKITLKENDISKWARVTEKYENGFIKKIEIGKKIFTNSEIKDILCLPGVFFKGKLENNIFTS